MTRVIMLGYVSGMRNGADWPGPGESIDVPDAEARDLIASGIAKAAPAPAMPVVETAAVTSSSAQTATIPKRKPGTGNR